MAPTNPIDIRPPAGLIRAVACAALGLVGLAADPAAAGGLRLHVPSPDWRDQVIYFVMTDRFADGDPANNDQGAGEFKAGDRTRYNGGDLLGLRQRLGYIRGLGATALWITPPVANQWLDPAGSYAGYHGYWPQHFKQVDPHLGTEADYLALSDALHRRGMWLIQDIVVNHTGNYFSYGPEALSADPAGGYLPHDRTAPVPRPSQPPFDRNDPRDPAQREAGVYHWTPDVADFNDPQQVLNFQMSGLDDLNTENPVVRRALRDSHAHWIRRVGVDAFRLDTAFYVPPAFFADFLHAREAAAPGIDLVARETGRRAFHVFGEGFAVGRPFEDGSARRIEAYRRTADGQPLMPGMLNFPLFGALGDTFARGRPPAQLADRIERTLKIHERPHLMVNFVDNHDVDRFLAGGDVAGLRQALLAMMTLPGIPAIYYGTEQGFTEARAAMFAAGWGSGGRDRYDTGAPLYRDIAAMTALRRAHRVFSRGWPTLRHANEAQAGALAWTTRHGSQQTLVVFNTADEPALLPPTPTGLLPGTVLEGLYGLHGRPPRLVVDAEGRVALPLQPRSGMVWRATSQRAAVKPSATRLRLDPLPARADGDFTVSGTARGLARLKLVVDGNLASATPLQPDAEGRWRARVDTAAMVDPTVRHTVTVWAEGSMQAQSGSVQVDRAWQLRAEVADPAGDDTGPTGQYRYPTHPSWGDNRQMDLRQLRVSTAGGALRLELQMAGLTTSWNPPHGFDHVHFTVFIELPGEPGGATVMPLQDANLPDGLRWHRRLRVGGWTNAMFTWEGASATAEGRPLPTAAGIRVDAAQRTVSLTVPAAALGRSASLAGARVYVTTWDYDSGYRALAPEPGAYTVGTGTSAARVMDASAVITLP